MVVVYLSQKMSSRKDISGSVIFCEALVVMDVSCLTSLDVSPDRGDTKDSRSKEEDDT